MQTDPQNSTNARATIVDNMPALNCSEAHLPPATVASILAALHESCNVGCIGYYHDLRALVERTSGSKHWDEGAVFVFASSPNSFIIMKQVAPASCEMLTVSNTGYQDVITAYRYQPEALEQTLQGFMDDVTPPSVD